MSFFFHDPKYQDVHKIETLLFCLSLGENLVSKQAHEVETESQIQGTSEPVFTADGFRRSRDGHAQQQASERFTQLKS